MLLRMFPLGAVHFPFALVPLRIFEPRYRELIREVEATEEPFGVVLIERGFEVGGGDSRFDVGTTVELMESAPIADGAIGMLGRGVARFRVDEWLNDDPYPRAEVTILPEPAGADPDVAAAALSMNRLRALLSELGADMGAWLDDVPDDPVVASFFLAAMSPVGPLDGQRLLAAETAEERLSLVTELTRDLIELAQAQLGGA